MTSLYETLEVSPHASAIVIRAAWRSLAQHYHPDKNPDVEDAGQRLMHINRAYAVLSDPVKRIDYDLQQGIAEVVSERRGNGASSPLHRQKQWTSRTFVFRPLI
jgi:DnaJ-class molecular chaperone